MNGIIKRPSYLSLRKPSLKSYRKLGTFGGILPKNYKMQIKIDKG